MLALFTAANLTPSTALRQTQSPAAELELLEPNVLDEDILKAMLNYPILVNRPIVCTEKGVKLCRPSQVILELLEKWPPEPFAKEDGELIIDKEGQRVS